MRKVCGYRKVSGLWDYLQTTGEMPYIAAYLFICGADRTGLFSGNIKQIPAEADVLGNCGGW